MKIKSPAQSAFFYPRVLVGVVLCFASVALAFFALHNASAQANPPLEVKGEFRGLAPVVKFDVSPALRDMQVIPPGPGKDRENEDREIMPFKVRFAPEWDPVVQSTVRDRRTRWNGDPGANRDLQRPAEYHGASPPDPNGRSAQTTLSTMGNLSFQIFNKTGTSLFGPAANNTLWAGFGGACQAQNAGDPVVLYDQALQPLVPLAVHLRRPFLLLRGHFANPRSHGSLLPLRDLDGQQFPGLPQGWRLAGCLLC